MVLGNLGLVDFAHGDVSKLAGLLGQVREVMNLAGLLGKTAIEQV